MNPNRGEDWLSRLERGVFGVFFLLRVDSPLSRTKAILWVISALQVFFLTVTVPSPFTQTAWFTIPRSLLDFSFSTTTTAMYVNFGVWSFLLFVFSTSAVLLGVFFQKEDSAILWPLRISRAFWFLFTWVLFVPALGALVDILDCRYGAGGVVTHDLFPELACWGMHAIPSAVALIMLAAILPVTAGCALFTFSRHGFDEHCRGRYDLLVECCKGLLVVAMRALTAHHELRAITALGTTALMTAAALLWLPYQGLFATVLYVCLYWVGFLGALESALLWFALPQFAGSWVPFVGLLGAAALTVPLVAWLAVVRYRRAVALSLAEVRRLAALPIPGAAMAPSTAAGPVGLPLNPAGVGIGPEQPAIGQGPAPGLGGAAEGPQPAAAGTPLATSLLYLQLAGVPPPEQVVARCRWAPAVEWATRFLRWEAGKDPRLVSYAEAIFSKGIGRFPASHGLLLNYAEFLQTAQRNTLAAITAVRRAAGLTGAALDTRFAVYAAERDYESQSSGTEGGLRSAHVMSMLTLRRSMRQAQAAHKRAKNHVRRVWAYLLRPKSDVRGLPPLLDAAVSQANTALEAYSSLLQSFPTSVPLLRGYGSLLQDLYGDIELAENLFAQADQLEEDNRACPGEETGSVHSALPVGAKGTRAALGAGSHKAPSMGKAPGAGTGAGGSRLSSLDGGALSLARQSVVSFLVNRHGAADELDEAAENDTNGGIQGAHTEIATRSGWLLFVVHVLALGLCAAFAAMQYEAITTSFDRGLDVHAVGNCSVLAERIAYEGRQVLELMMEHSDPPLEQLVAPSPLGNNTGRVVLTGYALEQFEWLKQRLYRHGQTLFDTILAHAAVDDLAGPWMTWKNPVLIPTVTEGTITTINQDSMNLWIFALDYAGKARFIGQQNASDLNLDISMASLLHLVLNGPLALGPALANMSLYTARSASTASSTMLLAPVYTGVLALAYLVLAGLVAAVGLGYLNRERKAVLAFFLTLPRDAVRGEFQRLQKKASQEEAETADEEPGRSGRGPPSVIVHGQRAMVTFTEPALSSPQAPPTAREDEDEGRSSGAASPTLEAEEGRSVLGRRPDSVSLMTHPDSVSVTSAADRPGSAQPHPPLFESLSASVLHAPSRRLSAMAAPVPSLDLDLEPTPVHEVRANRDAEAEGPGHLVEGLTLEPAAGPSPQPPSPSHPTPPHPTEAAMEPAGSSISSQLLALTLAASPKPPSPTAATSTAAGGRRSTPPSPVSAGSVRGLRQRGAVTTRRIRSPAALRVAEEAEEEAEGDHTTLMTPSDADDGDEGQDEPDGADQGPPETLSTLAKTKSLGAAEAGQANTSSVSEVAAARVKQLKETRVLSHSIYVRVLVGLVLVSGLLLGAGMAGFGKATTITTFQTQVAAAGIRLSRLSVMTNLVQQLVFNKTLPYAPSDRMTSPGRQTEVARWLMEDRRYPGVKTDRSMLRSILVEAFSNFTVVHRSLSYGGDFEGIHMPMGVHSLAARDHQWFHLDSCWMNDRSLCIPGRVKYWPENSTLSNFLTSFTQATTRMLEYDDAAHDLMNHDFEFLNSAYHWDLHDGLERITSLYHDALNSAVESNLAFEMGFFGASMASILFAFLFLFRVNLIQGELTKTALMRALLPKAAFQSLKKTSWEQVQPMNVKELDDLHASLLELINQARVTIAQMKPHEVMVEAFEAMYEGLKHSFEVEETFMTKYQNPHATAHRRAHDKYRQGVGSALEALRAGQPEGLTQARAVVADSSLPLQHGPKFDAPLGRYLNRHGVY